MIIYMLKGLFSFSFISIIDSKTYRFLALCGQTESQHLEANGQV
jgi:hypothetical protein